MGDGKTTDQKVKDLAAAVGADHGRLDGEMIYLAFHHNDARDSVGKILADLRSDEDKKDNVVSYRFSSDTQQFQNKLFAFKDAATGVVMEKPAYVIMVKKDWLAKLDTDGVIVSEKEAFSAAKKLNDEAIAPLRSKFADAVEATKKEKAAKEEAAKQSKAKELSDLIAESRAAVDLQIKQSKELSDSYFARYEVVIKEGKAIIEEWKKIEGTDDVKWLLEQSVQARDNGRISRGSVTHYTETAERAVNGLSSALKVAEEDKLKLEAFISDFEKIKSPSDEQRMEFIGNIARMKQYATERTDITKFTEKKAEEKKWVGFGEDAVKKMKNFVASVPALVADEKKYVEDKRLEAEKEKEEKAAADRLAAEEQTKKDKQGYVNMATNIGVPTVVAIIGFLTKMPILGVALAAVSSFATQYFTKTGVFKDATPDTSTETKADVKPLSGPAPSLDMMLTPSRVPVPPLATKANNLSGGL